MANNANKDSSWFVSNRYEWSDTNGCVGSSCEHVNCKIYKIRTVSSNESATLSKSCATNSVARRVLDDSTLSSLAAFCARSSNCCCINGNKSCA